MIPFPEASILDLLQQRGQTSAAEIGTAFRLTPGEVRARLGSHESQHLIAGRQDARMAPPARVLVVTNEGQRRGGRT